MTYILRGKSCKGFVLALLLFTLVGLLSSAVGDDKPLENSLGLKLVPAGTDGVLFCIWDVRVKDFKIFVDATKYDATANVDSPGKGGWKKRGATWLNPGFEQTDDCPVVGVNAYDGEAFCDWLTKKEQTEGKLGLKQKYRLPTNTEWNKAVGTTYYPWGDQWPPPEGAGNYAGDETHAARDNQWVSKQPPLPGYNDGYPRTSPVGAFKPNTYGLYDMGGNVMEWCEDASGWLRRGSSWARSSQADLASTAKWTKQGADNRIVDTGFRIVLVDLDKASADTPHKDKKSGGGKPSATQTPVPPAPPLPPASIVKLPLEQARAVVLIKGDHGAGTGFLVKMPDGPAVVTNLHVIANNPNFKITTTSGVEIKYLSAKGAVDRDLALLAIKDDGYSYLELATDISKSVQPGDDVITPGNSEGGDVVLNTAGKVLGIGPTRIEINNPIYHGNSGGPILDAKSYKVLGVVTEVLKVDISNELDKVSFASRNSAISGSMRYFGMRMDTVSSWVPIDWARFQYETAFLDKFDLQNRSLDSFLNRPLSGPGSQSDQATLYLNDPKITDAREHFKQSVAADNQHHIDALKELLFDLNDIADIDMEYIGDSSHFYPFDQEQVKYEMAYRKALKAELDDIGKDIQRMDTLP